MSPRSSLRSPPPEGASASLGAARRAAGRALAAAFFTAMLVAGCGGDSHQDLREWMAAQGKDVKGKVEPLPQVKVYEPFAYNAFDLPDPFRPRKVQPVSGGGKLAPDANRRKEPLEAFPLESIAMVGALQQGKTVFGLVRTPERQVYQVHVGNYMGQDYGVITAIREGEIQLRELVQDSAGDWTERTSTLQLAQPK
jgi:type IV pilus assembly protein PilP